MSLTFDEILRGTKEPAAPKAETPNMPAQAPISPRADTPASVARPKQKKSAAENTGRKKRESEREYVNCRRIPRDLMMRLVQHFPPQTSMQEIVNACLWAYLPAEDKSDMPASTKTLLEHSESMAQTGMQEDLGTLRDDISVLNKKLSELMMQTHSESVMTAYLLLDQAGYRRTPWPAQISSINFDEGVEDVLDAVERVSPKIKARRRAKKGVVAK